MAIPRNLSNLAQGADTSGVLGPTKGGTGLSTVGSAGNILTSNGSAWVSSAPAGGGSLILISSTNYSGTTNPTLTSGISSTYKVYKLYLQVYSNVAFSPSLRFYAGGSVDSNSVYNTKYITTSTTFSSQNLLGYFYLSNGEDGSSIMNAIGLEITIFAQFSQSSPYSAKISFNGNGGDTRTYLGGGSYFGNSGNNSAITGIQFNSFGAAVWGTISLYGVKDT